jgi:hypothetical protein
MVMANIIKTKRWEKALLSHRFIWFTLDPTSKNVDVSLSE